jgi:SAM-dependent methyltransferase
MSLAKAVAAKVPDLRKRTVYELSTRGAFYRFLQRNANRVVGSRYIEGAERGSLVEGARIEDVQQLTFPSASFDVCTSTEVFEHVADDRKAFAECLRVLKPDGLMLFTVPIDLNAKTRERAAEVDGKIVHWLPAEYHLDPAASQGPVLSFRDYGVDIVTRLRDAGFAEARIVSPDLAAWFGYGRPVILARKG